MRHLYWLRPQLICGRSGPDRNPWQARELASAGIGAVLSVNDAALVHPEDLAAVGIRHRCIPLSDSAPPLEGDLEACRIALPQCFEFASEQLALGRSVMVHCSSGKDRTCLFLAYYLCRTEGLSASYAMSEVRRVRPIAFTATGWEEFALSVLETCSA